MTGEKLSIISLSRRTVYAVVAVLSLVVYVLLAAVPTDLLTQVLLVLAIYTGLIVVNQWRHLNFGKLVYIALLTLLSLRYFIWRTFETLGYQDPVSFVFMMLLYTAEIFGFLLFAFGLFVNIAPLNREEEWVEPDKDDLPSVDVYIPTYNEAPELVAITVAAAAQIDYPSDKLNVYVLDDGGTKAKTTQSDPDARESAIARQKLIQNVCDQFEANYITREKNEQAKAGNFNSAFPKTNGDLILTLDADHVPTSDILMRTVGYFQKRDDLFLVQTPHFMINADPIERNLDTFRRMPSENEMFYRSIQRGLDFWDASFFCGSAAILRRKALEETNGLCTETITEDAETALTLHARGWHSVYVARPMVAGLAPETFSGLAVQRTRWAQGMVQILMLKSPLLMPNLTWAQRIGYLSSCLYWLFPIARFVFLLAPLAFLFFGLKIYNVTGPEFLVYTLPHFVGSMIYATFMFGKVRWPFIGVVYEIMQSLYALPSILRTFWRPRSPHFNVTPKGETLERDFVSPLSTPFYAVFCLVALAFVFAGYRWVHYPPQREVIAVISIWNTMNFISLLMALGTLMERRQLRLNPRIPADVLAKLQLGSIEIPGRLTDLSMGGTRFVPDLKTALPDLEGEKSGTLHIPAREGSREQELSVTRTPDFSGKAFSGGIGLTFKAVSSDDFAKIVTLVHGDSQRWDDYWKRNEGETRVGSALMFLFRAGIVNSFRHAAMLINAGWQNLKLRSRSLPEGRHKRASEASRL